MVANKTSRIAFVSTMGGVPWGGSEELWSQTALRLSGEGHDISASVYDWPTRPERLLDIGRSGGRVSYRPLKRKLVGRTIEKLRQKISPGLLDSAAMSWLAKEKPDLLVISQGGPWDGVPWMTACRSLGIAYCPIVHAHSEIWWPMDEDLAAGRSALAGARRVFFVSKANRNMMEMQAGVRLENAEVVINPWKVDASTPVPWPADTGITEIACVGRMDPRAKGQDVLLQVLALPKWRERPIRLNLYGDGPCEKSLEALARMLGLENIRFHGQVSDVRSIWAANHALVLPSRYEGLPLVIVEAMFCARPVITTDVAGNAELLNEGTTGFIAAAPVPTLLDETLERAWCRRTDWQSIGCAARQAAIGQLPPDPIAVFSNKLISLC
jgi:glycosyltransferase involved in cell wall biosynthesis